MSKNVTKAGNRATQALSRRPGSVSPLRSKHLDSRHYFIDGLLTALCLVHALEPVNRFRNSRHVVGYAGMDPLEDSSAERIRFGAISKAGPRVLRYLLVEAED